MKLKLKFKSLWWANVIVHSCTVIVPSCTVFCLSYFTCPVLTGWFITGGFLFSCKLLYFNERRRGREARRRGGYELGLGLAKRGGEARRHQIKGSGAGGFGCGGRRGEAERREGLGERRFGLEREG
ncbi:hypothetical protein FCM35_KLT04630 [Carex littledalei]|uniref:Uncharacterized protein n=1 Tax=Carex littledalei TaxID=544730 RepID=A0A833R416_9POAL|nr:hypothetical protein FCM35_KLT04630 [Carex littledalei]